MHWEVPLCLWIGISLVTLWIAKSEEALAKKNKSDTLRFWSIVSVTFYLWPIWLLLGVWKVVGYLFVDFSESLHRALGIEKGARTWQKR